MTLIDMAINNITQDNLRRSEEAKVKMLRSALREIEAGLANTGSTPNEWMTRITKREAGQIARRVLKETES